LGALKGGALKNGTPVRLGLVIYVRVLLYETVGGSAKWAWQSREPIEPPTLGTREPGSRD